MRTKKLTLPKLLGLLSILVLVNETYAADEICTFKSNSTHYANVASPAETLAFRWRRSTGKVTGFVWQHGSPAVKWFPYAANPGKVVPDEFPGDYHNRVNLGITTAGFESTRYEIRGYVEPNIALPSATFSGIYEGTGTAWIVAYGSLTCVAVP